MVCPKCKKEYKRLLALSRFDNVAICSSCGNKEAFEVMLKAGIISQEEYESNCKAMDALWKEIEE